MQIFNLPNEIITAPLSGAEFRILLGLYASLENGGSKVQISMEELADKIMIDDPRGDKISRITSNLQEKGFLEKRKPDFYSPLEYELKFPVPKTRGKSGKKSVKKLGKKYMGISLDDIPDEISEVEAKEFIEHRKIIKAPLTQEAFRRAMNTAIAAPRIGITANEAIRMTIDYGWRAIKLDWLEKRIPITPLQPMNNRSTDTRNISVAEQLTNRNWAK